MKSSKLLNKNLLNLPFDCCGVVLEFISLPKDFVNMMLTIKGFYEYVKSFPRFAKSVEFRIASYERLREILFEKEVLTKTKTLSFVWRLKIQYNYVTQPFELYFRRLSSVFCSLSRLCVELLGKEAVKEVVPQKSNNKKDCLMLAFNNDVLESLRSLSLEFLGPLQVSTVDLKIGPKILDEVNLKNGVISTNQQLVFRNGDFFRENCEKSLKILEFWRVDVEFPDFSRFESLEKIKFVCGYWKSKSGIVGLKKLKYLQLGEISSDTTESLLIKDLDNLEILKLKSSIIRTRLFLKGDKLRCVVIENFGLPGKINEDFVKIDSVSCVECFHFISYVKSFDESFFSKDFGNLKNLGTYQTWIEVNRFSNLNLNQLNELRLDFRGFKRATKVISNLNLKILRIRYLNCNLVVELDQLETLDISRTSFEGENYYVHSVTLKNCPKLQTITSFVRNKINFAVRNCGNLISFKEVERMNHKEETELGGNILSVETPSPLMKELECSIRLKDKIVSRGMVNLKKVLLKSSRGMFSKELCNTINDVFPELPKLEEFSVFIGQRGNITSKFSFSDSNEYKNSQIVMEENCYPLEIDNFKSLKVLKLVGNFSLRLGILENLQELVTNSYYLLTLDGRCLKNLKKCLIIFNSFNNDFDSISNFTNLETVEFCLDYKDYEIGKRLRKNQITFKNVPKLRTITVYKRIRREKALGFFPLLDGFWMNKNSSISSDYELKDLSEWQKDFLDYSFAFSLDEGVNIRYIVNFKNRYSVESSDVKIFEFDQEEFKKNIVYYAKKSSNVSWW